MNRPINDGIVPVIERIHLDDFTSYKKNMLIQTLRNGLNMGLDIGKHRTIGGEDTAMRYAMQGLAEGLLEEIFEVLRMVDCPDIASAEVR